MDPTAKAASVRSAGLQARGKQQCEGLKRGQCKTCDGLEHAVADWKGILRCSYRRRDNLPRALDVRAETQLSLDQYHLTHLQLAAAGKQQGSRLFHTASLQWNGDRCVWISRSTVSLRGVQILLSTGQRERASIGKEQQTEEAYISQAPISTDEARPTTVHVDALVVACS